MTLDTFILIICAVGTLGSYIYLKASGVMWYGIRWDNIFYHLRRNVCRFLLKLHK